MSEKPKKKKRSVASKYPTRQAMVYSGAAFLIVIVGLRTILSVMDEGFGFIEYMTIFGLALEFSMLLLYAWTIYSAGKESQKIADEEEAREAEEPEEEEFKVAPEDISELSEIMAEFASNSGKLTHQLTESHKQLSVHTEQLQKLTEGMDKLLGEQVAMKVRQEIQRLLSEK